MHSRWINGPVPLKAAFTFNGLQKTIKIRRLGACQSLVSLIGHLSHETFQRLSKRFISRNCGQSCAGDFEAFPDVAT